MTTLALAWSGIWPYLAKVAAVAGGITLVLMADDARRARGGSR